jgi:hypothetical protein
MKYTHPPAHPTQTNYVMNNSIALYKNLISWQDSNPQSFHPQAVAMTIVPRYEGNQNTI